MAEPIPTQRVMGLIGRAAILGLLAGLFGALYLFAVEEGTHLIWGDGWPAATGWFSGNIWSFAIPTVAGLAVGLVYRVFRLPARFHGFIQELEEGEVEPRTAPGALVVAVISLIGGASLGPEAPLGTAGGAMGTWWARRRGADAEETRTLSFVGISGAFGGLLSTPVGGPLLAFELEHDQTHAYYLRHLVPGVISGAVAFGVMFPLVGAPFEGLLSIEKPSFESWMLLAAVGLGIVGAAAALVVGRLMTASAALLRPLDGRPVLRGTLAGAAVGVIAWLHPLTLFSGQTTLPTLLEDATSFGVLTLVAVALLKAIALGISLGGGFYGGPIFPMFFIGGALGLAVHLLVPSLPIALAVGAVMAAIGAAVAMLPLSMAILVAIMIQSGLEIFGAVVLAAVVAYAIRLVLAPASGEAEMQRAASTG